MSIIDGDLILHPAAALAESRGKGLKGAKMFARMSISRIQRTLNSDKLIFCLSGNNNFRRDVYPIYKAHRQPKPECLADLQEYSLTFNSTVVEERYEADDLLAIYNNLVPNAIMCSFDKDLLQVPGTHYNWKTDQITKIDEQEGLLRFYRQVLTGDKSVDNIPGIHRLGAVTAAKLITDDMTEDEMKDCVACVYEKHYGEHWEEVVNMNAQLIKMLDSWDEIDNLWEINK